MISNVIFQFALFFVFIFAAIFAFLVIYLSWHFNHWTKLKINGPKPKLLVGTFPKSNTGICNLIEELHEIYLHYKSTDKFVGIFTARNPKLFILDPKLAKVILTQDFKYFHDNESSQWTSPEVEQLRLCSPFVSTGETWKERRSELIPALTANRIRAFYSIFRNKANNLIAYIQMNSKHSLNAKQLANCYTAEVMANYIWGIEENVFSQSQATNSTLYNVAISMLSQSLSCVRYYGRTAAWPWLRKFWPVPFFPATCDNFFKNLTSETFQLRQQHPLKRCDVIDHLQQLMEKKSLNHVQIAGHTTTVLIDGFETGAIVIAHCLLLLARNEHVQHKLRSELVTAGQDITYDELNGLPYLEQCLQETLRIFPPLPTLFKICTSQIALENFENNSRVTLYPNDVVYISAYCFHHDPDYYEAPEEFRPERFDERLGGTRKYRDMSVFLPFGDGPRICPGMKLGLAEAKVAVAEIIRNFRLSANSKVRADNKLAPNSFLLSLDGDIELDFESL